MQSLYLVRHGQTDWNRAGRFQGHTDVPLSTLGQLQAKCLARSLAKTGISTIHSSDLNRTHSTAAPLARRLGLPVVTHPGLRERCFGRLEGLTAAQIRARFPDHFRAARRDPLGAVPPQGESYNTMRQRAAAVWDEIAASDRGRVLIVAHGGSIKALLCHLLAIDHRQRWRLRLDNASVTVLGWQRQVPQLLRLNDTSHLDRLARSRPRFRRRRRR